MAQEGKPIWVESVLGDEDYKSCSKKYPGSFTKGPNKVQMFECDFKWRHKMGAGMTSDEIKIFNRRLEGLKELLQKQKEMEERDNNPFNQKDI